MTASTTREHASRIRASVKLPDTAEAYTRVPAKSSPQKREPAGMDATATSARDAMSIIYQLTAF